MIMPDYNQIKKSQIEAMCISTPAIMMCNSRDTYSYKITFNQGYFIDRFVNSNMEDFKYITLDEYTGNDCVMVMSADEILNYLKNIKYFSSPEEIELANKKIRIHNLRAKAYLLDKVNRDVSAEIDEVGKKLDELHDKWDENFITSTNILIEAQDLEDEIEGCDNNEIQKHES